MKKKYILLVLAVILVLFLAAAGPVAAATPEQIAASVSDGIDYLATHQNADGTWGSGSDVWGTTGLVLVKLEERAFELGYDGPFDPDYPLHTQVETGLNKYLTQASTVSIPNQVAGNPDTDGDGLGVTVGGSTYNTGILMMAIAASRAPARTVASGPLAGWTYDAVLQDMADWMSYAQTDNGNNRGGWSYSAQNNGGSADQSNAGYAVLGLLYAREPLFGFTSDVPAWVDTNLENYIDYIQSDWIPAGVNPDYDGGSGYTGPDYWVNSLKTGNLLTQMAMVGDNPAEARVVAALDYIGRHWNQNWVQGWGKTGSVEYQSAYCLMKGFATMGTPLNGVPGVADWFDDMATEIIAEQAADGSWPSSPAYVWPDGSLGHMVSPQLSTAWALLTLERFAPPPPVADFDVIKSASPTLINAGDPVTYTFNVVNTEDVNIINVVLTDDKLGVIAGPSSGDDGDSVLEPGETWVYTKTVNVDETTTNVATVEGDNSEANQHLVATSNAVTVTVTGGEGVPEFPSFAVPIGMILGIAFVAYSLRTTRKE
jgi:hypothetical protein